MKMITRLINQYYRCNHWPWLAAMISAIILACAYGFEIFGNYPACPLCIEQRWVHVWVIIVGIASTGLILVLRQSDPKLARDTADVIKPIMPGSRLKRFWLALRTPAAIARLSCIALAGLFAWSTYSGLYHAGGEYGWWRLDCLTQDTSGIDIDNVLGVLQTPTPIVLCDEASWRFLGISMAGYNALISFDLVILSVIASLRAPSWRQV